MTQLAGKLAIVTGASRGIGAATAARLHAEGAHVVRLARSLVTREHGRWFDVRLDLAGAGAAAALTAILDLGPPDIVVSNAGTFVMRSLEDTTEADFDASLEVNLRGAFAVARAFLPAMRKLGRGVFVQVGSIADHVGFPGNAAYSAAKYGLRGLHDALSAEYRGTGVRLSLVSPGPTDTDMWDPVDPDRRDDLPDRAQMLKADDVAEAITWVVTRPDHLHVDWLRFGPV